MIAHGKSTPEGIANAVRLAQRAVDERMVERTEQALEAAGVLRSAPAASFAGQPVTQRTRLWSASARISPRSWRSTRPRIQDGTRFKEDLEADSLDLVELVMELEDTYGIRIPDDEAAKILTVGQAADCVAVRTPQNSDLTPWLDTLESLLDELPTTSPGRRSPMRRGSSAAPTPTSGSPSWGTSS